jgi:hypothetical protein
VNYDRLRLQRQLELALCSLDAKRREGALRLARWLGIVHPERYRAQDTAFMAAWKAYPAGESNWPRG